MVQLQDLVIGLFAEEKRNLGISLPLEQDKKKLTTSLAVNMGLDVVYIVSGILLNRAEHNSSSNSELKIGYGNSLILQGGFLLIFDGVFLFKISR